MTRRKLYGAAPEMADAMLNPTVAAALPIYERFRQEAGWPYPKDATKEVTALAMVHKARLGWRGSTRAMIRESKAWLVKHSMSPTLDDHHHGTVQ